MWHTHLKKRLIKQSQDTPAATKRSSTITSKYYHEAAKSHQVEPVSYANSETEIPEYGQVLSPQECSSDLSTVTIGDSSDNNTYPKADSPGNFPEMDEKFWSEVLWESSEVASDLSAVGGHDQQVQTPLYDPLLSPLMTMDPLHEYSSNMHDNMDFWFNLFTRAGDLPELPDI